jgi:propanol-preferring alcohol dehydrogenase
MRAAPVCRADWVPCVRMAGPGLRMGVYGFGAAAHIIGQVALRQGREVRLCDARRPSGVELFARARGNLGGILERATARSRQCVIFAPVGPHSGSAVSSPSGGS